MIRLFAFALIATVSAAAQDWARQELEKSPRHREWVSIQHDGRTVKAFIVYPETKNKTPAVLVIHEIFGLSDWAQDVTDQVTAELNATADYALKLPAANGKLFVAGFCWGGGQSFRFATNRSDLAAAFVFYGQPPPKDAMARIHAPVYGFYAGNDERIDATIPDTIAAMKELGKRYDPVTYDGAGHGFMRAGQAPDATPSNQMAREKAWARWKQLMAGLQ